MLVAETFIRCTRGASWSYLRDLAIFVPYWFWASLAGKVTNQETRLYFVFLGKSFLLSWLLGLVIRDVMLQRPPPHPECDNRTYGGGFSVEVMLIAQWYVASLLHHMYLRLAPSRSTLWTVAQGLAWTSFLWITLVHTGYTTHGDFWISLAVGTLMAFVFGYMLYGVLVPRFPALLSPRMQTLLHMSGVPTRDYQPDEWRML